MTIRSTDELRARFLSEVDQQVNQLRVSIAQQDQAIATAQVMRAQIQARLEDILAFRSMVERLFEAAPESPGIGSGSGAGATVTALRPDPAA